METRNIHYATVVTPRMFDKLTEYGKGLTKSATLWKLLNEVFDEKNKIKKEIIEGSNK